MNVALDETRELEIAGRLGYDYTQDTSVHRPLTEYILPIHPFRTIGPIVIVTELILDDKGMSILNGKGKPRTKHKVRLLPRH